MNVTFPTLIRQFDLTTAQVQWVTTIYLLMISIIVPLSTYLNRNFSLKTLFSFKSAFLGRYNDRFLLSYLHGPIVWSIAPRCSDRYRSSVDVPYYLDICPLNRRGAMMGVGTLTTAIAPAIGPTYGGIMTSHFTWNHIFLFLVPVLILSLIIGWFAIPEMAVQKVVIWIG